MVWNASCIPIPFSANTQSINQRICNHFWLAVACILCILIAACCKCQKCP